MIKAGHIDTEEHAKILSNYLYIQNIENHVEYNNGSWELWILDSDHLDKAEKQLADYMANPNNPEYAKSFELAEKKRIQHEKDLEEFQKKMYTRNRIFSRWRFSFKSVTGVFIILSVLATLLSGLGKNHEIAGPLFISEYLPPAFLPEIRQGQVWRLITPIFLHFSFLHIFFNMWWLKDLGFIIEKKHGPIFLTTMIITLGILSNVGQYLFKGPLFGGMSGVVYGLLGYLWIRGNTDPSFGIRLQRNTVTIMIGWFFLCLTGLLVNIANYAHGVGLVTGMVWGFLSAKIAIAKRENK
jgi:GlpG protein